MSLRSAFLKAYGWMVGHDFLEMAARDTGDWGDAWSGSGWTVQSASGVRIDQSTAMACDAVMACVSLLTEDVAKLKPKLMRELPNLKRVPARDLPLFALLRRPNDWQTWQEFATMMMVGLLLRGNGYAVIVRDGRGRPVCLVPVNPDQVALWESPDGDLFWRVSRIGLHQTAVLKFEPFLIPYRDVFHLKGISANGLLGLSKIALNRESIGLALAQEQQAARWMNNGARPSGILTTDHKLNDESAARAKESWVQANSGIANTGKIAVLEGGLKWQPLSMTSADVEFIASRTFQLNSVARLWRVPPHMIGELTKATNNSLTQLSQEYVNFTLSTYTRIWAERMAFTFDLPEDVELTFDMSVLLWGDVTARYANYRFGQQGWLTCNEIRVAEGLDPINDPSADKVFRPVNLAPLDSDVFTGMDADSDPGAGASGPGSAMGGENPGAGRPDGKEPNPDQSSKLGSISLIANMFKRLARIERLLRSYNPDQPRDDKGRWTGGGAVSDAVAEISGIGGISQAEDDAIKAYTGGDYLNLNRELRGVRDHSGKYDATVQGLDTMLSRASLPEKTTVFRGVGSAFVAKYEGQLKKGFTFEDPGFVSTSKNSAMGKKFASQSTKNILMEIRLPKGANAADVSSISDAPHEGETLIHRKSSFKVVKWSAKDRSLTVEML
ncbi:MAG: phage portal protein [Clostridiaceae bacterium]|nr:phage portal protein [Clostridiaceae bacterium]